MSTIYERAKQLLRRHRIPAGYYSYDLNGNHYKSVMPLERMSESELHHRMEQRLNLTGNYTITVKRPTKKSRGHISVTTI